MLRVFFARGAGGLLSIGIAMLIANRLGASAPSDAFYLVRRVTLGLTEAVRRLVVTVSVPPIVAMVRAEPTQMTRHAWIRQIAPLFGAVTGVTILIVVLAGWAVVLLAPGFDADRQELSVGLLRILILTVPLYFALAALSSVSYALRRFVVPELAALLPRVLTILVLFLFVPPLGVTALGWAILGGTAIAVVFLMPAVTVSLKSRSGGTLGPDAETLSEEGLPIDGAEEPGFRRRIAPVLVFQIYRQLVGWVDLAFASLLVAGAVSIVEFGQRLAFLVPALLMNSFFTVLYTELAHDAVENGGGRLGRSVAASLRTGMFVLVPFAAFVGAAATPLVALVFEHGAFDAATALQTAAVTRVFAPAFVLAFVMRTIAMGAYTDSGLPLLRIVLSMVGVGLIVRLAGLATLPSVFGVVGIPSAVIVSTLATCATGYGFLARRWGGILLPADIVALGKILLATLFAWLGMVGLAQVIETPTTLAQILLVAAMAGVGAAIYVSAALLLGLREARRLRSRLLGRRASSE